MGIALASVVRLVILRTGILDTHAQVMEVVDPARWPHLRLMKPGPEGPGFEIISSTNAEGSIEHNFSTEAYVLDIQEDPITLEMLPSPYGNFHVMSRIDGATEYPVLIDTGCPYHVAVMPTILQAGDAQFYPLAGPVANIMGLCYISNLNIGDATLSHLFGACINRYMAQKRLGLTIWRERSILLGLPLLREFATFRIDGASKDIQLSKQSFQPGDESQWHVFPMYVKRMPIGGEKLFVEFPFKQSIPPISLDTGSFEGLFMTTETWLQLKESWEVMETVEQEVIHPRFGRYKQEYNVIRNLSLGDLSLPNAQILVGEKPYYGDDYLLLGMASFMDRTIVLDFKRMKLWVQAAPGAPAVTTPHEQPDAQSRPGW